MADKLVVGVYETEREAASAINRLLRMGYKHNEISVLARNPDRFDYLEDETNVDVKSPKDAARGAATGGVIGGIGGFLLGLGTLTIPGIGPLLALGPVAAGLAGIAAGSVVGALVGMGVEKSEAIGFENALKRGDLLVLVKADTERYQQVNDIFLYPEDEYYDRYDPDY